MRWCRSMMGSPEAGSAVGRVRAGVLDDIDEALLPQLRRRCCVSRKPRPRRQVAQDLRDSSHG